MGWMFGGVGLWVCIWIGRWWEGGVGRGGELCGFVEVVVVAVAAAAAAVYFSLMS